MHAAMRKRIIEKLQVLKSGLTKLTQLKKYYISVAETKVRALLIPCQQIKTNFSSARVPA
jgi:hypothetical protein